MKIFNKILNKKSRLNENGIFLEFIEKTINQKPKNIAIYECAFIHKSSRVQDTEGNLISYERLEFLGDTVLNTIISSYLFQAVLHADEGYLTKMRSKIVSREHLNQIGKELKLVDFVKSNVQPEHFGDNVHGNLFEALIGALFLDKGYSNCEKFVCKSMIHPYVDIKKLEGKITSYKGLIIEWCQKNKQQFNVEFSEEKTAESQKFFSVKLFINHKIISKARATSKKRAEETAYKRAYYTIKDDLK